MTEAETKAAEYWAQQAATKWRADAADSADPTLKHGGGGGTSGGMETVDAKIAASEARTDTKFAELRGDLKDFATSKDLRNNVWGAALALITVGAALVAFGGDRFDAGVGIADMKVVQVERDNKQDEAVDRIEGKLDQLIAAQTKPTVPQK